MAKQHQRLRPPKFRQGWPPFPGDSSLSCKVKGKKTGHCDLNGLFSSFIGHVAGAETIEVGEGGGKGRGRA